MNLLKKSDSEGPEASSDPPALSLVVGEADVEHQCPNLLIMHFLKYWPLGQALPRQNILT